MLLKGKYNPTLHGYYKSQERQMLIFILLKYLGNVKEDKLKMYIGMGVVLHVGMGNMMGTMI